jgi:hypothetical protein
MLTLHIEDRVLVKCYAICNGCCCCQVVDAHSKDLSLSEAQLRSILAARGHKKVAALAAVVRMQQFMDRCGV